MVEWEIGLERHGKLLQLFGATEADECNWEERKRLQVNETSRQLLLTRDVMSFANFPLCTSALCF